MGIDRTSVGERNLYRVEVPPGVDPVVITALPDRGFGNIFSTYAQCLALPGSAPVETPQIVAVRFWQDVTLPTPYPQIQPGRAITGKYAYLETRGETSHTFTQPDTPFGSLEILATGAYFVDWGDGTKTGPHAYEGGPWPNGRIKHEYINVGSYDVVVTERWTATWHFGAESGTLSELRTTGSIDDFPVEQIQVVRYR